MECHIPNLYLVYENIMINGIGKHVKKNDLNNI